jgi:hypothetical protein
MSHFTLLRLQLEHPARDLVWPFRGIGRLLVLAVEMSVLGRGPGDADAGVFKDAIEYLGPKLMSEE